MVFSKRTILCILVLLVLLSIVFRFPTVEHERYQADSYYIHLLSQSIVDDNYAIWTVTPLSLFGYYPMSYPSGVPFALAEISILTGCSVECSILFLDVFVAALFSLTVFCLGREFIRRNELVLLAVFFATVGPRFIDTSFMVGSARAPMVVLMVLMVFVCLRVNPHRWVPHLLVAALLTFGCFACHHMAVFFVMFGAAYVVSLFGIAAVSRRSVLHLNRSMAVYSALILVTALFVSFVFIDSLWPEVTASFSGGRFSSLLPDTLTVFVNMGVSYTRQIGFVLLLAVIGPIVFWSKIRMTPRNVFLVFVLIAFIPLLGRPLYVSMILLPFVSILGAKMVVLFMRNGANNKSSVAFISALVCCSLLLPILSIQDWNSHEYLSGDTVEVDSQVYNDASYLHGQAYQQTTVSNSVILSLQLSALSGCHPMRPGLYQVLSGDLSPDDLKSNVTWTEADFPENLYSWFAYRSSENVRYYVLGLMTMGFAFMDSSLGTSSGAYAYFSEHSRFFVTIDADLQGRYVSEYGISSAVLPSELRNASFESSDGKTVLVPSYQIYASAGTIAYLVELRL